MFESRSRLRRQLLAGVIASVLAAAPLAATAGENTDMARNAGAGFGSAIGSLIYAPVKVVYAVGGVVVSGLAFVFSGGDQDVARTVVTPAVLGDYVITSDHVRGERPIEFLGRAPSGYASEGYAAAWDDPRDEVGEVGEVDVAQAPDGW